MDGKESLNSFGLGITSNEYSFEIKTKVLGHKLIFSTSRYVVLEMKQAKNAYSQTISKIFFNS